MNDSTIRALRTLIDVILAFLVALAATLLFPGLGELLDSWTAPGATAAAGVVVGALTAFFSKLRNVLEDSGKISPVLYGQTKQIAGVTDTKLVAEDDGDV